MKNEIVVSSKNNVVTFERGMLGEIVHIVSDLGMIVWYLLLAFYFVCERMIPEVRKAIPILLEKAFDSFDKVVIVFIDFVPVIVITIKVGVEYLLSRKVSRQIILLINEFKKAANEVVDNAKSSTRRFKESVPSKKSRFKKGMDDWSKYVLSKIKEISKEFKMYMIYLWEFRNDIISEDRFVELA